MGLPLVRELFGESSAESPFVPPKMYSPHLKRFWKKKKKKLSHPYFISSVLFIVVISLQHPSYPRTEKGITKSSVITVFYIAKRAFVFKIKNSEERMCKFS